MWKMYVQSDRPRRQYSTAHARCMRDNKDYKHIFRILNIYYFSTSTMVARTRPSVALIVHCLSCVFTLYFRFYKLTYFIVIFVISKIYFANYKGRGLLKTLRTIGIDGRCSIPDVGRDSSRRLVVGPWEALLIVTAWTYLI
jgi:hypothetical protein